MGLLDLLLRRVFVFSTRRVCEREYRSQRFVSLNERSVEYRLTDTVILSMTTLLIRS
jgi:hypothetical protein